MLYFWYAPRLNKIHWRSYTKSVCVFVIVQTLCHSKLFNTKSVLYLVVIILITRAQSSCLVQPAFLSFYGKYPLWIKTMLFEPLNLVRNIHEWNKLLIGEFTRLIKEPSVVSLWIIFFFSFVIVRLTVTPNNSDTQAVLLLFKTGHVNFSILVGIICTEAPRIILCFSFLYFFLLRNILAAQLSFCSRNPQKDGFIP